MTPYGFWGDVILFGVFIVVFSFAVPKCVGDETDLQPFLIVRKGVVFVLRWSLLAMILACAVVLFAGAAVVIGACMVVLYIIAFICGIIAGIIQSVKRKKRVN